MGKEGVDEARTLLHQAKIPTYALPESAATAFAAAASHAEWVRNATVDSPPPSLSAGVVRGRVGAHAAGRVNDDAQWLAPEQAAAKLDAFGIRCLPSIEARGAAAIVRAASSLGYPVALKIVSRAVLHKSDVGGVLLDLHDDSAVRDGVATLERRMAAAGHTADLDGVLVQAMAPHGIEMFLGATRDATFGPVVAFGTGGVQLELWNDAVLRLAPVTRAESYGMVDSIRGRRLLDGFRGGPRGDREALADAIQRVSRLMTELHEVLELDLNPIVALEPGGGVLVVDARIRVVASIIA
jgi:acyl-CoA synthetase (NDP forming)